MTFKELEKQYGVSRCIVCNELFTKSKQHKSNQILCDDEPCKKTYSRIRNHLIKSLRIDKEQDV